MKRVEFEDGALTVVVDDSSEVENVRVGGRARKRDRAGFYLRCLISFLVGAAVGQVILRLLHT